MWVAWPHEDDAPLFSVIADDGDQNAAPIPVLFIGFDKPFIHRHPH